jgi:predicted PhzF superfamily epimerase YddE/YHI9
MTLDYATIDVFATTPVRGNPLAVVRVPASVKLAQVTKQAIAKEFNYSETVFIHVPDGPPTGLAATIKVDIFTVDQELPFAGHPTIGSSWYILNHPEQFYLPADVDLTLKIKAGLVPVQSDGSSSTGRVRIDTPVDLMIHKPYDHPTIRALQPALRVSDYYYGDASIPVVSIVKGMTCFPLRLSSLEALGKLQLFPARLSVPDGWLGDWAGRKNVPVYAYVLLSYDGGIVKLRTRLINGPAEDPATGSAAGALSGYISTELFNAGHGGRYSFEITQGVEIGRESELYTEVYMSEDGKVEKVELYGTAVKVMEGKIVRIPV